jgi:hypothetical protein
MRAHPSIAATASGTIGRKIPTTSPFSTPSQRRTLAKRCVMSRRSEYVTSLRVSSSPSQ